MIERWQTIEWVDDCMNEFAYIYTQHVGMYRLHFASKSNVISYCLLMLLLYAFQQRKTRGWGAGEVVCYACCMLFSLMCHDSHLGALIYILCLNKSIRAHCAHAQFILWKQSWGWQGNVWYYIPKTDTQSVWFLSPYRSLFTRPASAHTRLQGTIYTIYREHHRRIRK